MKNIRKDISIILGICSVILAMSFGLAMEFRLITILKRAFMSLTISILFGYFAGTILDKFISETKPVQEKQNENASDGNKNPEAEENKDIKKPLGNLTQES